MHILAERLDRTVAYSEEEGEERSGCHLHSRLSGPRAYQVCHIVVHSGAHHCSRRIAVEEVESIRMDLEEEGDDIRSQVVEEVVRNFEVVVVEDLRILRDIQILGSLTFLARIVIVGRSKGSVDNCLLSA